ncbi:MAG: leucine-rich repeat domain-containing protein [Clostridia bacterium]|nr:leucine-rich repeat domain-containing protein [Clostridia bacterium]
MSNEHDFQIENGTLLRYNGAAQHVEIPSGVHTIGTEAFRGSFFLQHVTVPDGGVRIAERAFYKCSNLISANIPDSVTEIGDSAFECCAALTRITVPEGAHMGSNAFRECAALTDADGFQIVNRVLYGYSGDASHVTIPDGVRRIDRAVFLEQEQLTGVTIPAGVTEIAENAFAFCSNLTRVELPDGLTTLGFSAFYYCENLTEAILPGSLTAIGESAFAWCGKLKYLALPAGLSHIPSRLCCECTSLSNVTFPDTLIRIGDMAFNRCPALRSLCLPAGVASIGCGAFNDCTGLILCIPGKPELHPEALCGVRALIAPQIVLNNVGGNKYAAMYGFFRDASQYSDPEVYAQYSSYALHRRKDLLKLVFREDLSPAIAFYGERKKITAANFESEYMAPALAANATQCVALLLEWQKNHIRPQSLEKRMERELMKDPFNVTDMRKIWSYQTMEDDTVMLTSFKGTGEVIDIPERIGKRPVTRLGACLFGTVLPNGNARPEKRLTALQNIREVHIPDGVTHIGDRAFYGCANLASVTIPDSVTHIGERAFSHCHAMADAEGFVVFCGILYDYYGRERHIRIPDGTTRIASGAFELCRRLRSVDCPDSLVAIEDHAFQSCKYLQELTRPAGIRSIGPDAFIFCCYLVAVFDGSAPSDSTIFDALPALLAPALPFSFFTTDDGRETAIRGFLRAPEQYDANDTFADYCSYAIHRRKDVLQDIFQRDMASALAFYAGQGNITAANFEAEYMMPAKEYLADECVAFLKAWQDKHMKS